MEKYLISIDQGTTSTRAILFTLKGKMVAKAQREIQCYYPHPAWVEQDPLEIIVSVHDVLHELMIKEDLRAEQIVGFGITNQRETTIVFDKATGKPVYRALVWQSKQSEAICDAWEVHAAIVQQKTGLRMNPYFSASKIRFILDAIPDGQKRAEKGELLFATVDSWIVYKLTQGTVHATDASNASRTLLYNIFTHDWDDALLSLFSIPRAMLPRVENSAHIYGYTNILSREYPIPIASVCGDQQASLFGQTCFHEGDCKNTYGTGCFMLMNIGKEPRLSSKGLLTTIAWQLDGQVAYAFEGSVFIAGASVQWLRDEIHLIHTAKETEEACIRGKEGDVYVVPAFVGLGTPYWDTHCRGAIFHLTRASNKDHIIKATIESIAYQSRDVLEVMQKEAKQKLTTMNVDGGASENNYLMQFQADILAIDLHRPQVIETTALGAFYLAGYALHIFPSLEAIRAIHSLDQIYVPQMGKTERKEKYRKWKRAVAAARRF